MSKKERGDPFENALAVTLRALAHCEPKKDADEQLAQVEFGEGPARLAGGRAFMPHPRRRSENIKGRKSVRGAADSLAVRLAHHDAALFARQTENTGSGGDFYESAEQARVEILGARRWKGVALNLAAACTERVRARSLSALPSPQQAGSEEEGMSGEILGLLVRHHAGVMEMPAGLPHLEYWQQKLESSHRETLDALCAHIDDQSVYTGLVRRLLRDLGLEEASEGEEGAGEDEQDSTEEEAAQAAGQADDEDNAAQEDEMEGEETSEEGDADSEDKEADGTETEAQAKRKSAGQAAVLSYKIWTPAFDEIISADQLCSEEELLRLRRTLDKQLRYIPAIVARLAHLLQRQLMARQRRSWEYDLEEGVLDPARLPRVVYDPLSPLAYRMEREMPFRDTVVTLLLDNSGSMRGRPITVAALCADIMARTLERCGVRSEILGFTTKAWKGGKSREDWINKGKPPRPGRLNDLRHIIYKSADMPWARARLNLGLMMREGLLKENIDGESLLWAHHRLLARPEERRVLMVISDGAPVDDATLSANSANYLERHLREVIGYIENQSPVELIAIGIGHDVTRYYHRAVTIMDVGALADAMVGELVELFARGNPASSIQAHRAHRRARSAMR